MRGSSFREGQALDFYFHIPHAIRIVEPEGVGVYGCMCMSVLNGIPTNGMMTPTAGCSRRNAQKGALFPRGEGNKKGHIHIFRSKKRRKKFPSKGFKFPV
jgi:hypothetical protein